MELKKETVETEVTNVAKKVVKRGVGSVRGASRLKFTHELAKPNGLFVGHLDSVEVSTIAIGEDKKGLPSFTGLDIPRIVFTFASNEAEANKRHYVSLSFTAVESNINTIPGGSESWKVDSVLNWFKHILDVFVFKGRELTEEEEAKFSLDFVDFDENGDFINLDVQEVIAGWTKLFTNIANTLNTGKDGGKYYTTKDNKPIAIWIKLIRFVRGKKGWTPIANGDLNFPAFVGEGCIEIYTPNQIPSIRVDVVKETILPMKIESKAKTPNIPPIGANVVGGMGAAPMGDTMMGGINGMPDFSSIADAAAEDVPF